MESPQRANQVSKLSNNFTDHTTRTCCLTPTRSGHPRLVLEADQGYSGMLSRGILREQNQIATQTLIAKSQSNGTTICLTCFISEDGPVEKYFVVTNAYKGPDTVFISLVRGWTAFPSSSASDKVLQILCIAWKKERLYMYL